MGKKDANVSHYDNQAAEKRKVQGRQERHKLEKAKPHAKKIRAKRATGVEEAFGVAPATLRAVALVCLLAGVGLVAYLMYMQQLSSA